MKNRLSIIFSFRLFLAFGALLTLVVSCVPQPYVFYDTKQSIRLSQLQESKTNITKSSSTCISLTIDCKYTIYKLPYSSATDYSSTVELSVIFDNAERGFLQNKGYFAVIVNNSNQEQNIYNYVQNYTHSTNADIALHEPFIVKKRTSSSSRVLARTTSDKLADLFESYCDQEGSNVGKCTPANLSTRKFFFGHGTQKTNDPPVRPVTTILRKKITVEAGGKKRYFLFWVEVGKECEELFVNDFAKNIQTLYELLYKINKEHIWGHHNFKDYLVADSIIHVALGDIGGSAGNRGGVTAGFVDPRTTYYNIKTPSNYQKENPIAPTIYLNINKNALTENQNKKLSKENLINFYSTLVHEFQHVFTNYQKTVLQSQSAQATAYQVDTWVHETLSVLSQYAADSIISELVLGTANREDDYAEYAYNTWYKDVQNILRKASLTNNQNFNANSYKVAYLLVSYLIQNYGTEFISNVLTNSHRNSYAIVKAVQETSNYSKLPAILRPKTIEDILLQFFTSIFTSNVQHTLRTTSHNYKFLTNDGTKAFWCNINRQSKDQCDNQEDFSKQKLSIIGSKIEGYDFFITSINLSPEYRISPFNIIFDAQENSIQNSNSLMNGKYAVAYLGGRLDKNIKQGVFKVNDQGLPYFTIVLNRGSAANLVVVEY